MSKIREYEVKVATADEYQRVGMLDRARELRAEAARMLPEVEAERAGIYTQHGGHLGSVAHAATAAAAKPTAPVFVDPSMTPERAERLAKLRAEALGSNLVTAERAQEWAVGQEREAERIRQGGRGR